MTAASKSAAAPVAATPLPRTTVRETALRTLRDMIVGGRFPVGQALRQDELAAQLGISRTPLREAFQTLATEGLVRLDPHRGAVVTKPSVQQLLDTYEIREALEVVAGRTAALLSTREHADRVARILGAMTADVPPDQWAELNGRFHAEIYSVVPNTQLLNLIDMVRNRAELYVRILARQERRVVLDAGDSHEQMLAALRRNDADAMENLIRSHLRATIATVAPVLESGTAPEPDPGH
jgi:DNA-binding GntR family transcriptional regulator